MEDGGEDGGEDIMRKIMKNLSAIVEMRSITGEDTEDVDATSLREESLLTMTDMIGLTQDQSGTRSHMKCLVVFRIQSLL